jgi:hypothetical protein
MKLRRPNAATPLPRGSGVGRPHVPEWLKEWRENQPQFVLLGCGHKEDVNARFVLIVKSFELKAVQVYCESCEEFRTVTKTLDLIEYHGLTAKPIPPEPLF